MRRVLDRETRTRSPPTPLPQAGRAERSARPLPPRRLRHRLRRQLLLDGAGDRRQPVARADTSASRSTVGPASSASCWPASCSATGPAAGSPTSRPKPRRSATCLFLAGLFTPARSSSSHILSPVVGHVPATASPVGLVAGRQLRQRPRRRRPDRRLGRPSCSSPRCTCSARSRRRSRGWPSATRPRRPGRRAGLRLVVRRGDRRHVRRRLGRHPAARRRQRPHPRRRPGAGRPVVGRRRPVAAARPSCSSAWSSSAAGSVGPVTYRGTLSPSYDLETNYYAIRIRTSGVRQRAVARDAGQGRRPGPDHPQAGARRVDPLLRRRLDRRRTPTATRRSTPTRRSGLPARAGAGRVRPPGRRPGRRRANLLVIGGGGYTLPRWADATFPAAPWTWSRSTRA